MEEYVNDIVPSAQKLSAVGFVITEEWIGTILLAGLPESYSPIIMGIESSGVAITGDSIKSFASKERTEAALRVASMSTAGTLFWISTMIRTRPSRLRGT